MEQDVPFKVKKFIATSAIAELIESRQQFLLIEHLYKNF